MTVDALRSNWGIVISAVFIAVIAAWMFRYQTINDSGRGFYRIDRWTGTIYRIDGSEWTKVAEYKLPVVDDSLEELGRHIKAKYPGSYDDLTDRDLGLKVKAKYPGSDEKHLTLAELEQLLAQPPPVPDSRIPGR